MAVRKILRMGEPLLFEVAEPVTDFSAPELRRLIEDMFDTMRAAGGVGYRRAANWSRAASGHLRLRKKRSLSHAEAVPETVLINPVITPLGEEETPGWEGCLSVPGLRGEVPRYERIRYTGFTPAGEAIDRTVEGFHARVVQHECDRLIGRLFPSRVRDYTRFGFTDVLFPALAR